MSQELLEGQPSLRGVAPCLELQDPCLPWWAMYIVESLFQRGQSEGLHHGSGQPVMHLRGIQLLQGLGNECTQPPLRDALRARIDRCQRLIQRRGFRLYTTVLGMDDLQAHRSAADLPEATDARTTRKAVLLRRGEVEESQRQEAGAIGDPAQELTPAAKSNLGELNLTLHHRALSRLQVADLLDARAIFISQRQHEEQVLNLGHPKARKPLSQRRSDASHGGDGALLCLGPHPYPLHPYPRYNTHSISTRAPRGSCDTPTAARAG